MKTRIAQIVMILGGLFILSGLYFTGMYVWGAVISRVGEADQSLVFWYLPLLFIGLMAILVGALILWHGIRESRNKDSHRNE